ncbi:NAD(P)-dependent alcohol dehydrogenase [Adhaeribacter aerolatus]|uniref:NAD(P)-dependent alcohol dehydrogenase n=1 Tax=Adhaeribacter aerolatus TaxID=670289 RepID=UPI0027D93DF5|nr:NAD(P)-dependent alcohol dehydrogenase [Adhaeribacter aerolatus]
MEKPHFQYIEILIRVKATAVNSADWRLRKAEPFAVRLFFGLRKPKKNILGGVLSGEVEGVGKDVTLLKMGDQVFGSTGMAFGTYAAYKSLPENGVLALKPQNITHQEAAVIPFGGLTALHFLKKAHIKSGQKVLIYGASGAVGTAAIQLAKYFGAHVTGVWSTANLELVKALGADHVIDYTQEDFTQNGITYDVIFDTVDKSLFSPGLKLLNERGILILGAAGLSKMLQGLWVSLTSTRKVITGVISEKAEDLIFLKELIEAGKLKPVIDRTYILAHMAEAHKYVEKGHKKGNVAITIN